MPSIVIAVLAGLAALYVTFKVMRLAMKTAFLIAVIAAGVAGYLTYAST